MKKVIAALAALYYIATAFAATDNVTVSLSGMTTTMSNGLVKITIGSNGRASSLTKGNSGNLLASCGIYFDYTASSNFNLNGCKVGTFSSLNEANLPKGVYLYRQGTKTGKISF